MVYVKCPHCGYVFEFYGYGLVVKCPRCGIDINVYSNIYKKEG